jgi:cytochrome c biogenesis protein CcmG/thiol:disulfide interchange protein DsbE
MPARGKFALQVIAVGVVGLLLALLGWRLASTSQGQNVAVDVDDGAKPQAPDFTLPLLGGDEAVRLSAFRGKAVVLNFWASWCGPCRDEAPLLQAASERWRDRGVIFIGVNTQDFEGDAKRFVDEYGITYLNVKDGSGSTLGRFGVGGLPETYFVDRQGRIVSRLISAVEAEKLEQSIELAVAS